MAIQLKNQEQKDRALALHKVLDVEITRANKVIRRHNKYDFLGYLSLRLSGKAGTPFEGFNFFVNVQAKILPNGFYLDMPQEQGQNGGWYSDSCFGSIETRAVLTHKVETTETIKGWIKECAALPKPGQEQTASAGAATTEDVNPYAG